jgi:hypothetical protein
MLFLLVLYLDASARPTESISIVCSYSIINKCSGGVPMIGRLRSLLVPFKIRKLTEVIPVL